VVCIPRFNVYIPKDVSDALNALSQRKDLIPMGGGSDLLVLIRSGIVKADTVLDLWPLRKELAYIKRENGTVRIGALTTVSELCESDLIKDVRYAGLSDVCKKFSTPFIRNIATVGGNVGAAYPLSDIALMLLVLNGKVKLLSKNGEREVDISKFFRGKSRKVRKVKAKSIGINPRTRLTHMVTKNNFKRCLQEVCRTVIATNISTATAVDSCRKSL